MKSLIINYIDYLLAALMAGLGGVIRLLHQQKKRFTLFRIAAEMAIAGFAGLLVNALMLELHADSELKITVVAISGYTSREIIEIVRTFAIGAIRATLSQRANSADENTDRDNTN